ncbi:hypothetical protein DFH28DRAFT_1084985 [Melampsora americana]|nr:hypothetical protein DFH28DRAFT_1084985 [Melampsora americana]
MIDDLLKKTAETGKPNKSIGILYDIGCTLEKSILKASHRNEILHRNAVRSTTMKLRNAQKTFDMALRTLRRLESSKAEYTIGYFSEQWDRQRKCQLEAMADDGQRQLEEDMSDLLDLEEKLAVAHSDLKRMQRKRRRQCTAIERDELLRLPSSIVALETAAQEVAQRMGTPEFRNLMSKTSTTARCLIRVRLAQMKLYEAKVGIIEMQKRWDQSGWGTKNQQLLKKQMSKKQSIFKSKWASFKRQVDYYNETFQGRGRLICPSLEEAKRLSFEDTFWNVGPLSHPSEKWAVDAGTKEGIAAFLKYRSCNEEFRRIGRETRQMVHAALVTEEKLDALLVQCRSPWNAEDCGKPLIDMVAPGQRIAKDVWETNVGVLSSLHNNLRQLHCRTWMGWNCQIASLLRVTVQYTNSTVQENEELINCWTGLVQRSKKTWESIVNAQSIQATVLDELEVVEQHMLIGEDGENRGDQPMDDIEESEMEESEDDK